MSHVINKKRLPGIPVGEARKFPALRDPNHPKVVQDRIAVMNKSDRASRLILPPVIYASVGYETNVYFDNVFLCLNPRNYAFEFHCDIGRCDEKRWRYIPAADDIGIYTATLTVRDESGIAAEGTTRIVVSDPAAKAGHPFRLLMIGDSLTDQTHFPARVHALCQTHAFPVTMLGTNCPEELQHDPFQLIQYPASELLPGVRHEGWGGWSARSFLCKTQPDDCTPFHHWNRRSPFLEADGRFDFKAYLDRNAAGLPPDIITIVLGCNDIHGATDETIEALVNAWLDNEEKLVAELRKDVTDAIFGLSFIHYGAQSQDAYGKNFGCAVHAWQSTRNKFYANARFLQRFGGREQEKLYLLPLQVNLDRDHGFPKQEEKAAQHFPDNVIRQCNAYHPNPNGYSQVGDTYFAWLTQVL